MDIMQAIIDIEKKAQGIVDSVDEMKKENSAEIQAEIAKEKKAFDLKLTEEKQKIKEKYDVIRETEMTNAERKYAERLESLDKKCKTGKEKWAAEIAAAVING